MSFVFFSVMTAVAALAQEPAEAPSAETARQERLQFLKEKVTELVLYRESSRGPLPLYEKPINRYSIPERDNETWDGVTFLWLDGARPVAAVAMGIRKPNNAVVREQASFSSTPLVCEKAGAVVWAPRTGGLLNRPFGDAPTPAASLAGRLTQMRTLARRFSATCYRRGDATELRLMPQPLHRFSDEKNGVLDGGLFALAVGNDAEMLLLLEAVNEPAAGKPQWRYSLARMSSLKMVVRLDDAEIWVIPRFYDTPAAERKTGPYVEAPMGTYRADAATTDEK